MPDSEAARALAKAAEGLTYQSETDAPWKVFTWPAGEGSPTPEAVRRLGRDKPDAPASVQSIDEFFAPQIQQHDWFGDAEKAEAAKYGELLGAVKKHLQAPIVVRVGERKLTVYVVGQDPAGGWTGLKTSAVET
jgi:nuclease A inhibitor-like protein